jgi:HPt (histidine-containing phosphotransfer) domain-containing protein
MKEMFLSKGFNDYLSKPIEISRLDEILTKWIPPEKKIQKKSTENQSEKEKSRNSFSADYLPLTAIGVDVNRGFALTGGSETAYRKVLTTFRKDVMERLPLLGTVPGEQELLPFTTNVHALKSAAATIGAKSLSQGAEELETAGKARDMTLIAGRLSAFCRDLQSLAEQIGAVLDKDGAAGSIELTLVGSVPGGLGSAESKDYLPLITELLAALEREDVGTIRRLLLELEAAPFDGKTRELLTAVSNEVLMSEFAEAIEILTEISLKEGFKDAPPIYS